MQCNEASAVSDAFCANSPSVNYVCVGRDSRSFFVLFLLKRALKKLSFTQPLADEAHSRTILKTQGPLNRGSTWCTIF